MGWYLRFANSGLNYSTCHIATIALVRNNLTGTLPERITLPLLVYFSVSKNRLYGRLPTFNTPLLADLDLQENSFSGSIPNDMIVSAISELRLNNNLITGSLPDWIYSLSSLNSLHVQDNHLTGTLSSKITNLQTVRHILLENNRFHGSIPQDVLKLPIIRTFNADNNFFSGALPKSFNITWRSVLDFSVTGNNLEGPLPTEYVGQIESFLVSSNYLTGTLPSSICKVRYLHYLGFGDNQLHGTIPACFWDLDSIILEFEYNLFHGPINLDRSMISVGTQPLSLISIGFNYFSGAFPGSLLKYPKLLGLSTPNNCFKGGFENFTCEQVSSRLKYIDFDGLYTPQHCRKENSLISSFDYFGGPLPDCILRQRRIEEASLAGNGFFGKLPQYFLNLNEKGLGLNLSRNFLVGTIPSTFNQSFWSKLDLSYNKLYGTIPNLIASEFNQLTSVILNNNRFSFSSSPLSLKVEKLIVSQGNLLQDDPIYKRYQESYSVKESRRLLMFVFYYFLFACISFIFILLGLLLKIYKLSNDSIQLRSLNYLKNLLICLIACLFLLPCYYFFHHAQYVEGYKMYENTHDWSYSSLYLGGYFPGGIIATCLITINLITQFNLSSKYHFTTENRRKNEISRSRLDYSLIIGLYILLVILSFFISVTVNEFYLRQQNKLILKESDSRFINLYQVLMMLYNLVWNRYIVSWIFKYLRSVSEGVMSDAWHSEYLVLVLVVNSVIVPWSITMIKDEACFEGLFFSKSEVHQLIGENECNWWNFDNTNRICHRQTSFTLPFLYYHLCGWKFLLNQLPVWIYYYAFILIISVIERLVQGSFIDSNLNFLFYQNADRLLDLTLLMCFGIHYPFLTFMIFIKAFFEEFLRIVKTTDDRAVWTELPLDSTDEIEMTPPVGHPVEIENIVESQQISRNRDKSLQRNQPYHSLSCCVVLVTSIIIVDVISDRNGILNGVYFLLTMVFVFVLLKGILHARIRGV